MELCTVFFKGFNQFFFEKQKTTTAIYIVQKCNIVQIAVHRLQSWSLDGTTVVWSGCTLLYHLLLGKTITQVNLPARTHWDFRASFEIWAFTRFCLETQICFRYRKNCTRRRLCAHIRFCLDTQICFRYRNNCTRRRLCDHKVSSSKHRTAYCCWVGGPWRNCTTYIPLSILKNVLELMT